MANEEQSSGKQGFASMDEDKQREIASMGGKASHGGSSGTDTSDSDDEPSSGKGKQGFASMDPDQQREIASKGGRTKTAGEEPEDSVDEDVDEDDDYAADVDDIEDGDPDTGTGKQGFASMDEDQQREIASKGGRTKTAGEEPADADAE